MDAEPGEAAAAQLARSVLTRCPPDRLRRPDAPGAHFLVLGTTALAREICRGLLRLCHFRHGVPPMLSIAGGADAPAIDDYLPGAELIGQARMLALAADDAAALRAALAEAPPVSAIYACAPFDPTALRHVFDGFPPPLTTTATDGAARAFPCCDLVDLAGPAEVDGGEDVARAIHEFYLLEQLARGRTLGEWATLVPWDQLDEADRDANRFLADHMRIKLGDVGCGEIAAAKGGGLQFTPRELEELARAEHRRWCAVRLLAGYRYGAVRDDARKLHPQLIPFDELDVATQDLDRIAVRATDAYLARAGRGVVRAAPVALLAEPDVEAADGFPAGVRRLLRELARHYPDRRIVLRSDLAAPAARTFCQVARDDAGLPLAAVVADAPPAPELWPLLARAGRIEVVADAAAAVRRLPADAHLAIRIAEADAGGAGREILLDVAGRVRARPWRA